LRVSRMTQKGAPFWRAGGSAAGSKADHRFGRDSEHCMMGRLDTTY